MDEILSVQNLTKHFIKKSVFSSSKTVVRAVDDVSFSLKKGEVFVLAGESGSGKTTTARLVLRAIEPDSGKIFFDGIEIEQDSESLGKLRMQCQMVYQDPYASINPRMKVSDIIMEPLEIHKIGTHQ
ncbi:MAG: ATP-binding cassette domain-containing protein, partial [Nitrosopumilaceae archaeon]